MRGRGRHRNWSSFTTVAVAKRTALLKQIANWRLVARSPFNQPATSLPPQLHWRFGIGARSEVPKPSDRWASRQSKPSESP